MLLPPASIRSGRGGAVTLTIRPATLLPPTSISSGRGGAVTPLSGTSCLNTTSGISCLDPQDNQDQPEDITFRLDDSSGHAPSSRLD